MAKFKFGATNTAMLGNIRVSDETHHKIKSIAQKKGVTMQTVTRVFIEFALTEFEKEYAEHFLDTSPDPR